MNSRHVSVQLRHISAQLRHTNMVHTKAWDLLWFPPPQEPVGVFDSTDGKSNRTFSSHVQGHLKVSTSPMASRVYFLIINQWQHQRDTASSCCSPQGHLALCPWGSSATAVRGCERRAKEREGAEHSQGYVGSSSSSQALWRCSLRKAFVQRKTL